MFRSSVLIPEDKVVMSCTECDVVLANPSCQTQSDTLLDNPRATQDSGLRRGSGVLPCYFSPHNLTERSSTLSRHAVSLPQLIDTVAQGIFPKVLHSPAVHQELLHTSPSWPGQCREARLGRLWTVWIYRMVTKYVYIMVTDVCIW